MVLVKLILVMAYPAWERSSRTCQLGMPRRTLLRGSIIIYLLSSIFKSILAAARQRQAAKICQGYIDLKFSLARISECLRFAGRRFILAHQPRSE
jgi:hypothetical protein